MPGGFGSQAFGSTPYGIGTPAQAPASGGKILRNPQTGASTGSRRINPRTKDYELDEYGRLLGMSSVHQLVLLAVSTTKGTSAMRELGQEIRTIERLSPNVVRRIDSTLRASLAHLVNRRLIEVIDTLATVVRPGAVRAHLRWRDLTTGEVQDTPLGTPVDGPTASAGPPLYDRSLRTEDGAMLLAEDGEVLTTES